MIDSKIPAGSLLGGCATSIRTPTFNCFVSTARRFFISNRWETMILDGIVGVDKTMRSVRSCARVFYAKIERAAVYEMHDELAQLLDSAIESGATVSEAAELVLRELVWRGLNTTPKEHRPIARAYVRTEGRGMIKMPV